MQNDFEIAKHLRMDKEKNKNLMIGLHACIFHRYFIFNPTPISVTVSVYIRQSGPGRSKFLGKVPML
jgi:hypothetical protein